MQIIYNHEVHSFAQNFYNVLIKVAAHTWLCDMVWYMYLYEYMVHYIAKAMYNVCTMYNKTKHESLAFK